MRLEVISPAWARCNDSASSLGLLRKYRRQLPAKHSQWGEAQLAVTISKQQHFQYQGYSWNVNVGVFNFWCNTVKHKRCSRFSCGHTSWCWRMWKSKIIFSKVVYTHTNLHEHCKSMCAPWFRRGWEWCEANSTEQSDKWKLTDANVTIVRLSATCLPPVNPYHIQSHHCYIPFNFCSFASTPHEYAGKMSFVYRCGMPNHIKKWWTCWPSAFFGAECWLFIASDQLKWRFIHAIVIV